MSATQQIQLMRGMKRDEYTIHIFLMMLFRRWWPVWIFWNDPPFNIPGHWTITTWSWRSLPTPNMGLEKSLHLVGTLVCCMLSSSHFRPAIGCSSRHLASSPMHSIHPSIYPSIMLPLFDRRPSRRCGHPQTPTPRATRSKRLHCECPCAPLTFTRPSKDDPNDKNCTYHNVTHGICRMTKTSSTSSTVSEKRAFKEKWTCVCRSRGPYQGVAGNKVISLFWAFDTYKDIRSKWTMSQWRNSSGPCRNSELSMM